MNSSMTKPCSDRSQLGLQDGDEIGGVDARGGKVVIDVGLGVENRAGAVPAEVG